MPLRLFLLLLLLLPLLWDLLKVLGSSEKWACKLLELRSSFFLVSPSPSRRHRPGIERPPPPASLLLLLLLFLSEEAEMVEELELAEEAVSSSPSEEMMLVVLVEFTAATDETADPAGRTPENT